MTGIYILLGGITLVVGIITAWDLWTRRQDRRRAAGSIEGPPDLSSRKGFSKR